MSWDAHLALQSNQRFVAVRNAAGLYAIWPESQALPIGWTAFGKSGTSDECIEALKQVWPGYTLPALRKRIEEMSKLPLQP